MSLLANLANKCHKNWEHYVLSRSSRRQARVDHRGLPELDPGPAKMIHEGIAWLGRAQDRSASNDGGVARDFSLTKGWATSYPETTGYIVPTMLDYARAFDDESARESAARMLDWLTAIQLPGGGFQGGRIDATPVVPVTFNTGQILLGLAAGVVEFGDRYRDAMERAAQWLVDTQDPDGCWRKHPTPFAEAGEKAYETHVSWGLFEAARVVTDRGFGEAGLRNVLWALTKQRGNGWFDDNCLSDPARPLTHTIGYALRGVLEAFRFSGDRVFQVAARKTADGLLQAIGPEGYLPGMLDDDWAKAADWVCLTGSAQIAHCFLLLHESTGEARYRDAGYALNSFVRRTVRISGEDETRGAVKGSFPLDGGYGTFQYLNWAVKFAVDSNVKELEVRLADGDPGDEAPLSNEDETSSSRDRLRRQARSSR